MDTRQEIVRAILAEMRAKLAERDEAGVLYFSQVLSTFTQAPSLPDELKFIP